MSVDVEVASVMARYTNNNYHIATNGKTVGECIQDLARQYPEFGKIILGKNRQLMPSIDVFVNGNSFYPNTMTKEVKEGDKLSIVLLIHGG
jgi:hypothetical protein